MNRSPHQPTLRELIRPVLAHKLLLVAAVVLAVIAAVVYSKTRNPVYQAQASVAYQDPSYDLGLVGLTPAPALQSANQLAAQGAETILQPTVAQRVRSSLGLPQSADSLLGMVSTSVAPSSNLVEVQASARTGAKAQALANAFAQQGAAVANAQLRAGYAAGYNSATSHGAGGTSAGAAAGDNRDLSRLRLLSSMATAAQVVRPATLPSTPTSPRTASNVGLAAILGIVLGLIAVYLWDALDPRLRSGADVEDRLPFPLLGHVRREALGRSARTNGEHGEDPVDWELFRIIRRNLDFLEPRRPPCSVAVTGSVGQEGKSTVAASLAFTSAAAGRRTVLVECDLRRPVLAERLGLRAGPGINDFVAGRATREDILQPVAIGAPLSANAAASVSAAVGGVEPNGATQIVARVHAPELSCITGGTSTVAPVPALGSPAFETLLRDLVEEYDLVVLDTPPLLSVVDTLELLPQVDSIVLCVRLFKTTQQQAAAACAALERLPGKPTGVVVTGTRRAPEREYGHYGYPS